MQVTIGGDRIGAGNKNKVWLKEYERSSHDLGYIWRSTMASGTLVPFMSQVALPGDTFDINLNVDVLTHPTVGPLFGTYKVQLDVFQIPIRLYQAQLHMNALGIGMNMSQVLLPQMNLEALTFKYTGSNMDNQQINPSSIFAYLGIRGLGNIAADIVTSPIRRFNAVTFLGYWDIYKNYYANKQEEIGAVIHQQATPIAITITAASIANAIPTPGPPIPVAPAAAVYTIYQLNGSSTLNITCTGAVQNLPIEQIQLAMKDHNGNNITVPADKVFKDWIILGSTSIIGYNPNFESRDFPQINSSKNVNIGQISWVQQTKLVDLEPKVVTFPLVNIDTMRKNLLTAPYATPYIIDKTSAALPPYTLPFQYHVISVGPPPNITYCAAFNQEGLALKTYNSDLFNNWISTDWIDNPVDGISAITAIDTSGGSFTIDELNLSKKIYDMLNRIALSGGSYDDWLDAVYTHERNRSPESPIYLGGLIRNLVFQEVVSNAASQDQPLGTLAGRGRIGNLHKGGQVIAKIDEPSYLMGIVSITPNIDYSQGNQWDVNLRTMNDFHKPALDEIGFQDLTTDQFAWWDTRIVSPAVPQNVTYKSAGKQPAWINYMTNVNKVLGNFADQSEQMFMVLNRRYEIGQAAGSIGPTILDVTTYIDPSKFNHIFADTRRDAQNFWVQIGLNIEARRKMSARIIPNL